MQLDISRVRSDADLEAMRDVRALVNPDLPPPRVENLRHNLHSNRNLLYLVARTSNRPVGCGFVEIEETSYATAHVDVVPDARRRGVGSSLLAELSRVARDAGKDELQGEVREIDDAPRRYFERRGYRAVGGERAVALDLASIGDVSVEPPPGIRIVPRAKRSDLLEGMYTVAQEAHSDIPGETWNPTFDEWRKREIDRPTRRADLSFVALAGEEVVGFVSLDDFGQDAYHALTAVSRSWRRRGVATALKRMQILGAKEHGFRRLVTESEERNTPMRNLNEKLGYRPEPSLSVVVIRGPLL
jgi:GNAT superfamily N-acetyltransferase